MLTTNNEALPFRSSAAALELGFGHMLAQVQAEAYPAKVAWQTELDESNTGYIVTAAGTLRALAVVEQRGTAEQTWLLQAVRVRPDTEDHVLHSVLQDMLQKPDDYSADEDSVSRALYNLYLARGLILQYPSVILECNKPGVSFSNDAQSSSQGGSEFVSSDLVDIRGAVEAALDGNESSTAHIAIDVATHMGAFPETFVIRGETYTAYRTQLSNYPWAYYREDVNLRDLVLIKIGEGRAWAIGEVSLGRALSPEVVEDCATYEYQVPPSEITAELTLGIIDRIHRARGRNVPDYLMVELLAQEAKVSHAAIELITEISQYDSL